MSLEEAESSLETATKTHDDESANISASDPKNKAERALLEFGREAAANVNMQNGNYQATLGYVRGRRHLI